MQNPWYKRFLAFMHDTYRHFMALRPTRMAASLSYYALFGLVPMLLITFWLGSVIVDSASLQTAIIVQVSHVLGTQNADFIQTVFVNSRELSAHLYQAIIAVLFLIVLAGSGMSELKDCLDDTWETPYDSNPGIGVTVMRYLISFAATFGFALVFIVFILGSHLFQQGFTFGISDSFRNFLTTIAAPILLFIISSGLTFLAYAFLPERKIPKRYLAAGSIITGIFLTIGNIALGYYLAQSTTISTFGVAGSIVAILLWFYYSSLIFLLGASGTWEYFARKSGIITLM